MIRDQGERQLDSIGKTSANKAKAIELYDKKDKDVEVLVKKMKHLAKKVIKKIMSKGDTFDFNKYKHLIQFGTDIPHGETSLNESKKE